MWLPRCLSLWQKCLGEFMYNIHNHMIFLDSDARNALHEGKEVEGQGFLTVIDMEAKKLDFSMVDELVCRYKIN